MGIILHVLGAFCTTCGAILLPKWLEAKRVFELTGTPIDLTVGLGVLIFGFVTVLWLMYALPLFFAKD